MNRFAPLGVAVILIALFALGILRGGAEPELALAGKPVPEIAIDGLKTDDFKHGTVLVNFFASWCVTCVAEQQVLAELRLQNPALKLVGIAYKDDPIKTALWLKRHGNPFDLIGHDGAGQAGLEWGVTGVPGTYIIRDGIVRARAIGVLDSAAASNLLVRANQ